MESTPTVAAQVTDGRDDRRRQVVRRADLDSLVITLKARGFEVIAPVRRDGAIVLAAIDSLAALPRGWAADQEPGRYRLRPAAGGALFGPGPAATSCRAFLHPASERLFAARRSGSGFQVETDDPPVPRYAFVGIRACDLAAVARLDRVLKGDRFHDTAYQARRDAAFFAVVDCREPASTCFCASVGGGPVAAAGYDLRITEITEEGHRFLLEPGSAAGADILATLPGIPPDDATLRAAGRPAAPQARSLPADGLAGRLCAAAEHPRWQATAARCLACANCTMVCPTCFCTTVEDTSGLLPDQAARWRRADSCFTLGFSYIHGGSVRATIAARYRQWLLHKLATWHDQFGTTGCVGCGRCIAWCPAGIDITEEARAVAAAPG